MELLVVKVLQYYYYMLTIFINNESLVIFNEENAVFTIPSFMVSSVLHSIKLNWFCIPD